MYLCFNREGSGNQIHKNKKFISSYFLIQNIKNRA